MSGDGRCVPCADCLTRAGVMVVVLVGKACSRCSAVPDPKALVLREIRAIVREGRR